MSGTSEGAPLTYPKLDRPPINEVICGFIFDPAPVDVLDFGIYWQTRVSDFPRKELHTALFDEAVINLGGLPARAWLVSPEPEAVLLQLQHDRFYMNWRARGTMYPRFTTRDGIPGLKSLALEEWDKFSRFVASRPKCTTPRLRRIELAKVDILERGTHWQDHADLGRLMRVAAVFREIQLADLTHLQLRLTEKDDANKATLVTVSVTESQARVEARVILQAADDLDALLTFANDRLNAAFFGLLDPEERKNRFGGSA